MLKCEGVHFCSTVEECVGEAEVIFVGTSNFKDVKSRGKVVLNPW